MQLVRALLERELAEVQQVVLHRLGLPVDGDAERDEVLALWEPEVRLAAGEVDGLRTAG